MRWAGILALTLFASTTTPLVAEASPTKQAYKLYEQARQSYRAKDFHRAHELVKEAQALSPQIEFETFSAWCVFRAGDEASGLRSLSMLLEKEGMTKRQTRDLEAHLLKMRSAATKVRIEIEFLLADSQLLINGVEYKPDPAGRLSLNPGSHTFEFVHSEHREIQNHIIPKTTEFKIQQSKPPQSHPEPALTEPEPTVQLASPVEQKTTKSALAPIILTGSGVLLVGLGTFFQWRANSSWSALRAMEKQSNGVYTGLSQHQAFDDYSEGYQAITLARSFYGVGGALVLAGISWWLYGSSEAPETAVHRRGDSFFLTGRF